MGKKFVIKKIKEQNDKIITFDIEEYSEVKSILERYMRNGHRVQINISKLNNEEQVRVIDVISGAVILTGGSFKEVSENEFLFMVI